MTVKEAAKILGKSPQFVRIGLQRGVLLIGTVVKMSSRWTYHISEEQLKKYAGEKILIKYVKQFTKELNYERKICNKRRN